MMIHMIMIMALIVHTKNQILMMMIILIMMMALTVIFCPAFGGRSLKMFLWVCLQSSSADRSRREQSLVVCKLHVVIQFTFESDVMIHSR